MLVRRRRKKEYEWLETGYSSLVCTIIVRIINFVTTDMITVLIITD